MQLSFEKTRDGYFVTNAEGRGLCRIQTKRVAQIKHTQPPDGRVVYIEEQEAIPHEQWTIHFCAGKRSAEELQAILSQMPAQ